jgi:hypothetical protein
MTRMGLPLRSDRSTAGLQLPLWHWQKVPLSLAAATASHSASVAVTASALALAAVTGSACERASFKLALGSLKLSPDHHDETCR